MDVKVFVPVGENPAGFVNCDLEILLPTVPQMSRITKALTALGAKISAYNSTDKTLRVSMPKDITLDKLQVALGDSFKVQLDEFIGRYDGTCSFQTLLETACAKEKEAAISFLKTTHPSL